MRNQYLLLLIPAVLAVSGCSDSNHPYTILPAPLEPVSFTSPTEDPPPPPEEDLPPPPEEEPPVPPEDVSGTWYTRVEKNGVNCGMGETIDAQAIVILQDEADVTLVMSTGDEYTGSVNGDIVEWAGSYFEHGGTANFTSANLVVSANSASGNAAWTWSNGTDSCNGTMAITAGKDLALHETGSNSHPEVAIPFDFVDNVVYFEGSVGNGLDRDDYFTFVATADGMVQAELSHFDTARSDLDLYLFDEDLNELSASFTVDSFEVVEAPVTAGGTYYIKVETALHGGLEPYILSIDFNE